MKGVALVKCSVERGLERMGTGRLGNKQHVFKTNDIFPHFEYHLFFGISTVIRVMGTAISVAID